LIDFILIAILSGAPGELLAIAVAITSYRIGNVRNSHKTGRMKRLKRMFFQVLGAFIIFVVLIDTLPDLFEDSATNSNLGSTNNSLNWVNGIALGALSTAAFQKINTSTCKEVTCWQSELLPFVEKLPAHSQNDETVKTLVDTMVATVDEKSKLNRESKKALELYFFNEYLQFKTQLISEDVLGKEGGALAVNKSQESSQKSSQKILHQTEKAKPKNVDNSTGYKGIEWMKGIIEDLGLGFGWAAFYFTVLTSIWNGQTPGKKLFNIRVVQLDGTKLSLWDSFGRYGGYGAGLATGLLGFLQIYWDPNRQAIHDKISATIVIDVKKLEQLKGVI
jgi:hypothetical protein